MNDQQIKHWLRRFGYHRAVGIRGIDVATVGEELLEKMIYLAQGYHGLLLDGIVGPKTIEVMARPRCGCPDYMRMRSRQDPAFGSQCRLAIGVYADWTGIKGISPKVATDIMIQNFQHVEPYNLHFEMVDDPQVALINIRMGQAQPGVLAWMEVGGGCGWQHQSLFNIDVDWSPTDLFRGTNMHEVVGHGAGVGHSPTIGSIMDPVYDLTVQSVIDPWFDKQLKKRYGLVETNPTQSPTTNPPGVPGMDFAAILAIILPIIIECIKSRSSDADIEQRIRNPNPRQVRILRRGVKRKVRREEPGMRKRDRRVKVDTLVDTILIRGREATTEEITGVIAKARNKATIINWAMRDQPCSEH